MNGTLKREMSMKEISSSEESKAFKARLLYFEDALQQANVGAHHQPGNSQELDPNVIEYAERVTEEKTQSMHDGHEEPMNDSKEYWSREFQQRKKLYFARAML